MAHAQVKKLKSLLETDKQLKQAVELSIQKAALQSIPDLNGFYGYIDRVITHIPSEKDLMPSVREFYYVLSHSPGDLLKSHEKFNDWINEFVRTRGDYMDSPDSVSTIATFINNPEYAIDDYVQSPSGWLTFNQFLARHLKPGKRPIAAPCDDSVIVSPVDGEYMGQWAISEESSVTVKGTHYMVSALLEGSAYTQHFNNGIFTHTFLPVSGYHRFHTPVRGTVIETKIIDGKTWVTETKKPDGTIENIDDVGFQFTHTRGYIIIDSPVGLVMVMPVGMGHISSVVITAEKGSVLEKGEEFGYFAFGGSDIIVVYQQNRVNPTAEKNRKYKKGEQVGTALEMSGKNFIY